MSKDMSIAEYEAELLSVVAQLQRDFEKAAVPYVKRLAALHALKPPQPIVLDIDFAKPAPNYKQFAVELLQMSRRHDCADVGGDDVQELALRYGLLQSREVTTPCGPSCDCSDVGALPCECFFYAPDVLTALNEAKS